MQKAIESLSQRIGEIEKLVSNLGVRLLPVAQWQLCVVFITGALIVPSGPGTGKKPGGVYTVRKSSGTAGQAGIDAFAGNNLTMPEGMTLAPADDQHLLVNLFENATSNRKLASSTWHLAVKIGEYRVKPSGKYATFDVFACDIDTGPQTAQVLGSYAYFGGSAGGARYKLAIAGGGAIAALDPYSNFRPPDSAMTFGTQNAVGVNTFEGGSATTGTAVVAANRIVTCFYRGLDNENPALPVYYFDAAPTGTLFRVALTQNGGSNGNKTYAATWTYDVTSLDGLQLGSMMTPERPRPLGTMTAATKGTAYIDKTGAIVLAEAWEIPGTGSCS